MQHTNNESAQHFDSGKTLTILFLCSWWIPSPMLYQLSHPVSPVQWSVIDDPLGSHLVLYILLQLVLMFMTTAWLIPIEINAYIYAFISSNQKFVCFSWLWEVQSYFWILTKSLGLLRLPWRNVISPHSLLCYFRSQLRCPDRLGDIVVRDALLVCLGSVQCFTWMNSGSSFCQTVKIEWVTITHLGCHETEHTYFIWSLVQGL